MDAGAVHELLYAALQRLMRQHCFNHRLHKIDPTLWQGLFSLLAEFFKRNNSERTYTVDSLPVAACDNIRIRRCRLYPQTEYGGAFRAYVSSKRRYFYGLRVHLVVTGAGEPVEFSLAAASEADVRVFKDLELDLPDLTPSSARTKPTPTTTTKTCSKKRRDCT